MPLYLRVSASCSPACSYVMCVAWKFFMKFILCFPESALSDVSNVVSVRFVDNFLL